MSESDKSTARADLPYPGVRAQPIYSPPMDNGLPAYVEHGGDISGRHPAEAANIRMYAFTMEASRKHIDAYCKRLFNVPSHGSQHWQAMGDFVLVNFVDIPSLKSADPVEKWLGIVEERELAIWMPIVDVRHRRMAWAIPYIFVDSDMALVGGRETYGFPKQLGKITMPKKAFVPHTLSVDALSLKTYGPTHVASQHEVLHISNPGVEEVPLVRTWTTPLEMMRDLALRAARPSDDPHDLRIAEDILALMKHPFDRLADRVGELAAGMLLANQLSEANILMVFLKQFRDAEYTNSACYQAIVEVSNAVTAFAGGGLLPDGYDIDIAELADEPIMRELGIRSNPQRSGVAFWLEFDFTINMGRILYEAHAERHQI